MTEQPEDRCQDSGTPEKTNESSQLENAQNWFNKAQGLWGNVTSNLSNRLPVQQVSQTVTGWFSVDEAEIAEILKEIRAELPTTDRKSVV